MAIMAEPVGFLEVLVTGPRMSGYAGPAWPRTCTIRVAIDGEIVGSQTLPFEFDNDDFKAWRLGIRVPVSSNWPDLSLDIFVERADFLFRRRRTKTDLVVTRGGPHTSGHTAVVGRARVRLLDALVLGDMDKEEEEKKMKQRHRNGVVEGNNPRLLEGTMPFGKVVKLLDRELPPPGGEESENPVPRGVVRGTVDVHMNLRPPFF